MSEAAAAAASTAAGAIGAAMERGTRVLHSELPGVVTVLEWVAAGIDVLAVAVMVVGALRFAAGFLRSEIGRGADRLRIMSTARLELGRYILAGLEVLIVSDIIHTALSLAFGDLLFLGLLVLIRSAVSYVLTREIRELKEELA